MTTRRAVLAGLAALVAAPAVIRTPGLLMPVRRIVVPSVKVYFVALDQFVVVQADGAVDGGRLPSLSREGMTRWAAHHPDIALLIEGRA